MVTTAYSSQLQQYVLLASTEQFQFYFITAHGQHKTQQPRSWRLLIQQPETQQWPPCDNSTWKHYFNPLAQQSPTWSQEHHMESISVFSGTCLVLTQSNKPIPDLLHLNGEGGVSEDPPSGSTFITCSEIPVFPTNSQTFSFTHALFT